MSETDKAVLRHETPLRPGARRRVKDIGWADVLIGIPSHRNGRTMGEVVHAVAEGIRSHLPDQRVVLMNADGGSSDNSARHVADVSVSPNVEKLVTVYTGSLGKGMAIRAIFEAAAQLEVRACAVIEAQAPGIVPEWIPALVAPVAEGSELALGCYQRSAYAAALTDNLAYPLLRMLFRSDLREPLAGEFCISGALAGEWASRDVWETDVARFGINVWLAIQGLAERRRMAQVDLEYRGDGSGEPGMPTDPRFSHMVDTLFRCLTIHRHIWQESTPLRRIPFHRGRQPDRLVPCLEYVEPLVQGMRRGRERCFDEWRRVLSPEMLEAVEGIMRQPSDSFDFPVETWARVLLEFAVVHNKGEGDPDKVVDALLPLLYGRAAAYLRRSRGLTIAQREAIVEEVVQALLDSRPFLLEQWNNYQPWIDASGFWFS